MSGISAAILQLQPSLIRWNYRCIRLVVPDERQAMYDRLKSEIKVLTAEGIYKSLTKRPLTWLEMEAAKKQFVVDDHDFLGFGAGGSEGWRRPE